MKLCKVLKIVMCIQLASCVCRTTNYLFCSVLLIIDKVMAINYFHLYSCNILIVLDPKKGVCADPVDGGANLGRGGPDPHSRDRERQLAPDKGSGKM